MESKGSVQHLEHRLMLLLGQDLVVHLELQVQDQRQDTI